MLPKVVRGDLEKRRFLVDALKEGDNLETVRFTTVVWCGVDIPIALFY
jgi:hypothetical protein